VSSNKSDEVITERCRRTRAVDIIIYYRQTSTDSGKRNTNSSYTTADKTYPCQYVST